MKRLTRAPNLAIATLWADLLSNAGIAATVQRMVGQSPLTSFVNTSRCSAGWPRLAMISPKPNTPMAMTTKPMPSVSCGMSKL